MRNRDNDEEGEVMTKSGIQRQTETDRDNVKADAMKKGGRQG